MTYARFIVYGLEVDGEQEQWIQIIVEQTSSLDMNNRENGDSDSDFNMTDSWFNVM